MARQIREGHGYSLRALADKVGMSYVALFRLENGQTDPRLSTLRKLAKALNVAVAEIIDEAEPSTKHGGDHVARKGQRRSTRGRITKR